tara:strand:+ start:1073 stop:2101 length:1029 start_codon:yes stop_codon:yes gene_type:complete
MSSKNLNVTNKTHKFLINKLKDKKTFKIYKDFEKNLQINDDFIVAVSGGPDSLALSFLSKLYAIKNSLKVKYFIVDHKLRKNSTKESKFVKRLTKKIDINLSVLTWTGKKPTTNIQSIARKKRYNLLINQAKKLKINYILLGHHIDDLYENFFIRILRGSGLNGMVSFDKISKEQNINLIRPLLNFSKEDLENITKKVFSTYINDSSNMSDKFKRVKIRNFIKNLQSEGLDLKKFNLTIKNLKFANESIKTFVKINLDKNSIIDHKNKSILLSKNFFNQPQEIVFRSFTEVIKIVGKKYYPVRGKKLDIIINKVKNDNILKTTLGNCIIRKVNRTIIVTKEH